MAKENFIKNNFRPKKDQLLRQIAIKKFPGTKVAQYNHPDFIQDDPVLIPHSYQKQQDIAISGF